MRVFCALRRAQSVHHFGTHNLHIAGVGTGQALRRGHVVRAPNAERSRFGEPVRAALQPEPNPSLNSSPSLHLNPSPTPTPNQVRATLQRVASRPDTDRGARHHGSARCSARLRGGTAHCAHVIVRRLGGGGGSPALLTGFGDREAYSAVRSLVLERGFLPRPSASQRSSAKSPDCEWPMVRGVNKGSTPLLWMVHSTKEPQLSSYEPQSTVTHLSAKFGFVVDSRGDAR